MYIYQEEQAKSKRYSVYIARVGSKIVKVECIYIDIYCHPQTDCSVLSELFYVRLSIRPLG